MKIHNMIFSYAVHSFIADIKKNPGRTILIAFSAIPAFEMAIRSVGNLYEMIHTKKDPDLQHRTGGNLMGVILLTTCALETFPGARLCGAAGFIYYSVFKADPPYALISSGIVYSVITTATSMTAALGSFINIKILALAVLGVTGYFIYLDPNKDKLYLEIVSKTRDMFSKVWRNV